MSLRVPLNVRGFWQSPGEPYVCASCLLKATRTQTSPRTAQKRGHRSATKGSPLQLWTRQPPLSKAVSTRPNQIPTRHASNGSLASRTAINAPTNVPTAYRELYQQLLALQETAGSYVDLSRIQLATRSLESSNPVIRVALLGLGSNGTRAAGKLARVLLSDVLSQEEPFEEEVLETVNSGRNILLQYGDAEESAQSNALVRTVAIPSRFLQRHNLELLITTLNTDSNSLSSTDWAALEEAVLVPPLTTPNSADGRVGFVRYPVHKAVLVAEGIAGAVEYGRLPAALTDGGMINAALSVPLRSSTEAQSAEQQAGDNAVDLDLATHALRIFREDNANGANFSDEWQTSRVPVLSDWISGSRNQPSNSELNPAIYNLIASILSRASTSISISQDADTALATANTVPEPKRMALQSAITEWSADAHRDLQNNLDVAFRTSPSWRRTKWWRLFWRIDDVTISAANVLRSSWLTQAEQQLAFLSGRIFDSGLATAEQLTGPTPMLLEPGRRKEMETYEANKTESETVAELMQMPSMLSRVRQQIGINALFNPPWPQNINLSRQYMLHSLVPDLHRKAQALLVTTLSTIGGATALSGWFFLATAGHGLYESGAIFALGLVWSVRRLQRKWSKEREDFASAVREDARRVLGEVEAHLRRIVNDGGKASVRSEDLRLWQEASEAVEGCKTALEKLRSGS